MSLEEAALDLCAYIDRSPTPFHAAAEAAKRLVAAGFTALDERDAWPRLEAGDRRFVIRGGSTVVAFVVGAQPPADAGLRMIGAHTDSPTFRLKPLADVHKSGYRQVGVEPYGSPIYATWLDRDLSIAGRVTLARGNVLETKLVDLARPIARVPQLAIHLNRGVNTDGLVLNPQKHLSPILGVGDKLELAKLVASELGETSTDIVGLDLVLYDTQRAALGGADREIVYAARLDNLGSCHAALRALIGRAHETVARTRLIVLYDHEECGSLSAVGADGTVLEDIVTRIVASTSSAASFVEDHRRTIARSILVSADMAHAIHPNYSDQHEPQHTPELGKGTVIKSNANQRYATNGETYGWFALACREAGFTPQSFVTRSDLPCGSTIGPITAAKLGVATVDVGNPMLSMHSCREMAGTKDVSLAIAAFGNALCSS